MLNRLKVKNFKALKDLDIQLRERNVFIGRNNSGKSTILHALATMGRMLTVGDVGAALGGATGFQQLLWKGGSEKDMLFEIWGDDKPLASDALPTAFHYSI
jgi:predicted ATPase